MEKLVVVIMGQNCEKFIGMCLDSVKDADAIVFCDGGSIDGTLEYLENKNLKLPSRHTGDLDYFWRVDKGPSALSNRYKIIENPYDQEDKKMNGKQRNFYLDYIKKNYPDYWCLAIDADEVVEDLNKIKELIKEINSTGVGAYSIKMIHFIGDLGHEDSTLPKHYVPRRLFRISDARQYPEVEHTILEHNEIERITDCTTIWHLAYIPNLFDYKKKYKNHIKKSEIHSSKQLKNWYYQHLFGWYPRKQINPIEIPRVILNNFGVDKDEMYFKDRLLEVKHFLMMNDWLGLIKDDIVNIIDFGCGFGHFGYAFHTLRPNSGGYHGIDINQWAVKNSPYRDLLSINQGSILDHKYTTGNLDLVLCIDILEHLEYGDLDKAIKNVKGAGKILIVSIPFKGTLNCDNDPTHIIKEDKNWWIERFVSKGLKLIPTPKNFLYKEQILIFEKCQNGNHEDNRPENLRKMSQ